MDKNTAKENMGATQSLPTQNGSVFQVRDATDDERYYPLAMFPTLQEALNALDNYKEHPDRLCDYADEVCTIEIWEIPFGFKSQKRVAEIVWNEVYDDEAEDCKWEIVKQNIKSSRTEADTKSNNKPRT